MKSRGFNIITIIISAVLFILFMLQSLCLARFYRPDTRVVIFDFDAINVPEGTARAITELVTSGIVKYKLFTVIDRKQLTAILKEQEFQSTGCTSEECRIKLGQLFNAEKIVYGSISNIEGIHFITIKIVDVEKGNIEWSDTVKVSKMAEIDYSISVYLQSTVLYKSFGKESKESRPGNSYKNTDSIYLIDGSVIKGKVCDVKFSSITYFPEGRHQKVYLPRSGIMKIVHADGLVVKYRGTNRAFGFVKNGLSSLFGSSR